MDRKPLPRRRLALAGLLACALLPTGAGAQSSVPETVVRFVPGTSSVSMNGQLKGPDNDARDYVVRAEGGQTLGVRLQRASPETWFVVLHPYGDKVYGNEGDQRTSWSDRLVDGGDYRVRVYLGREAARQAKGSAFTLVIDLK